MIEKTDIEKQNDRPKKDYEKPTVEVVYYQVEKGFQASGAQPQPQDQIKLEGFTEDADNSGENFWGT